MKHIKTLGLLAIAVMAMAAFFGTASASAAKFTAGKVGAAIEETTLKSHVFTITGSKTECTTISFAGATEGTDYTSQKVTPSYSGCTAFGFAATITNSCYYTLQASGEVQVQSAGCSLLIKVSNAFAQCEVTVGSQNIPGAVTYTNSKEPAGHLTVAINGSKIDAKVLKSSGLCPLTVGTHNDAATYTGESTVKAAGTTIGWDA